MRGAALLPILFLWACGPAEDTVDGFNWDLTVTGTQDLCNPQAPQGFQESYTYTLLFDGSITELYIGDKTFAAGIISGCTLEYESPVVGERRGADDEFWIKWQLTGEAILRQGGGSCELEEGVDWSGIETFEVVETDDPSIEEGCTYELLVEGVYTGQSL